MKTLENSSHDPDKVIYNFSDYKLTESEKSVLCKGLEFAIPPNKLEYADFMLPFELFFAILKTPIYPFLKLKPFSQKF